MPRVALPVSGNVESDIVQLFPVDLWMLHYLGPPYRFDNLALSQSQSNLVVVRLPPTNHLNIKSSLEQIGKCAFRISFQLVYNSQNNV